MAVKSITRRWTINSLMVILIAIIAIVVLSSLGIKEFYYSSVQQELVATATSLNSALSRSIQSNNLNYANDIRTLIEGSSDKDKFEITAIDYNGMVVISSSGFLYNEPIYMADYKSALTSADGMSVFIGQSDSGENIMAVSIIIPTVNSQFSALRLVTSLEKVNSAIVSYIFAFAGIGLLIVIFVLISGLFFINSIVLPVRQIAVVARKFASGDMEDRIQPKTDDEIGELSMVINHMADEICESENMKNEFISSVSHELRTPLTAIKGWGETLLSPDMDDMTKKGLGIILSETDRLSIMVEELLDFSRMQNGNLTLVKNNFDVVAELQEVLLIYEQKAERENININYHPYNEPVTVFGDKNRIRQVFINVIDNAIKYSNGGTQTDIKLKKLNNNIEISVQDQGCGIKPEDLPHVKTKFFRVNHNTRGSGIGLAVANDIVKMHDGEIKLSSVYQSGTTVTIVLPLNNKKHIPTEISSTQEFTIK